MIQFAKNLIIDQWNEWFQTPLPHHLDFIKIAGNALPEGRVIFLIFADNTSSPCLVLKTVRSIEYINVLAQEYDALTRIQVYRQDESDLPRPLWYGQLTNGDYIYIESAITGTLMGNMRRPWLSDEKGVPQVVQAHFEKSANWLLAFNRQTSTGQFSSNSVNDIRIELNKVIYPDSATVFANEEQKAICDSLIDTIGSTLTGIQVLKTCEHGDFWAGNIYLTRSDSIGVVDWTDAQFNRLPLYDVAFFSVSYALGFSSSQGNQLWMFEKLIQKQGWFADLVYKTLDNYCRQVGLPNSLDPSFLIGLALARRTLVEQSRGDANGVYSQMFDYWAVKNNLKTRDN